MMRYWKIEVTVVAMLAVVGVLTVIGRSTGGSSGGKHGIDGITVHRGDVFMSPKGSGSSCSRSDPCQSLAAALKVASNRARVVAASGDYGDQTVKKPPSNQAAKQVTVISATGQGAVFRKTLMSQAGVTFDHVTFRGPLRINDGPLIVHAVHVVGAPILVRASDVTITNSLVEGGAAHDGINIAGRPAIHNIVVRQNIVRDIGASSGREEHPDCIQIFDANHITIDRNNLYNCWNSGITFSHGAKLGVSDVVITSNFIQGCIRALQACGNGGSAMDLRLQATRVTLNHNTFGFGSVRLPANPGVTATANIVGYLSISSCATAFTDSIVIRYTTSLCKTGLPGSGNILETPEFVDESHGNLRLVGPASAIPRVTAKTPPGMLDINGHPFGSKAVAGAFQP